MKERHAKALAELDLPDPLQHLIHGELLATADKTLVATDPSTGAALANIPQATDAEIDAAVEAAQQAQQQWRRTAPAKRRRAMLAFADKLKEQRRLFPTLEALDVGMPQTVSKQVSSRSMVRNLQYYAEWADKIEGAVLPAAAPGEALHITMQEPVGVVAAIIPWNTPCLFLGSKTGPALAAGCSIIIKPSEQASLPAFAFARAAADAGLPPGLVQVLLGDGEVGKRLCEHRGVDKIAFTGGTVRGREIMAQASSSLKRVLLELGGKSPNIVFADADIGRATMMSTFGVFGLSGQGCAAGSRLFVHESVSEQLVQGIATFASSLALGDPLSGDTMLGPLNSERHLERVEAFVEEAKKDGAEVLCGGERADLGSGSFYKPTILRGVDPKSRVAQEEIFGPVLCVFEFSSTKDVVQLANDVDYGLAAGIWTKDLSRALRVAAEIKAGTVWVNMYGQIPVQAPFGGFKQSGFGRDGGREGLLEYLETKHIAISI